jgi:phage/plasmid-like protein (TIGR03299 family)
MSHAIEVLRSGQANFFSARQPAWHRLGTVTPEALSAEDALATARLGNWNVVKRPVFTTSTDGVVIQIKGKYSTVRRNPDPGSTESDALGIVGEDYEVIQNEEAFSFLTALVEHGDAAFETAGSLRGGTRVFVTMKIPEPMKIADNEELDPYVAVATGHDGLFAFSAFPTPVRVVCQNTLSLALSGNKSRNLTERCRSEGSQPPAGQGVAVHAVIMARSHGRTDYRLVRPLSVSSVRPERCVSAPPCAKRWT